MSFDESCIFCKIVRKQAPSSTVYEDKSVMAFLDIRPLIVGHTLVIPKAHYVDIFDTPAKVLAQVYSVTKHVSTAVKSAFGAEGISIIQQNGKAAGQDIFHLHVVPRFEGQKLPSFSDLKVADRSQLDETALKIKEHL